jgi:nucleoside-diphosphate-sugar epimerase
VAPARILLTGATGFIGSRLLPLLNGHEVLCLTRDAQKLPALNGVKPLPADLTMPDSYRAAVTRFAPQWCFHLAWEGLPDYSAERCRANLAAGIALFDTLAASRVARVVVAGSCWEYGAASAAVDENRPGVDCGIFAASKDKLRRHLASLAQDSGFDYRWARVFFAYGAGQRSGSLIPLCHAAYSSGREPEIRSPDQAQDFIHIDDVARGLKALAAGEIESGVYNVGTGTPETVGHVVNIVAAHFGRPAPFSESPPAAGFWADMAKTTRASGWRTSIPLADGVRRTLAALDRAA